MKTLARLFGYLVILALFAVALYHMVSYWLDVTIFNFASVVFTGVFHVGVLFALSAVLIHYHKATKYT